MWQMQHYSVKTVFTQLYWFIIFFIASADMIANEKKSWSWLETFIFKKYLPPSWSKVWKWMLKMFRQLDQALTRNQICILKTKLHTRHPRLVIIEIEHGLIIQTATIQSKHILVGAKEYALSWCKLDHKLDMHLQPMTSLLNQILFHLQHPLQKKQYIGSCRKLSLSQLNCNYTRTDITNRCW